MSARSGLRADKRSGYNSYMKKATIAHLKNNLSRYLSYVRRGGRITIFNRDTPIAELIPARAASSQDAGAITTSEASTGAWPTANVTVPCSS